MATSGTIYGSFTGRSTSVARPYIIWSATQNVANNTSTITATLIFVRYDGYRSWNTNPQTYTIKIDGDSLSITGTYDMGPNGKTSTIGSVTKTVTHNSDGRKSVKIEASGYTGLSNIGNVNISQTITLDTIPRASDFTAFSLSSTSMAVNTSRTINYTLDRKSSSFTHQMTLRLGSKTIKTWTDSGTGSRTQTLSGSEVNTIISSLPTSTSGTLTLTMQTKQGSTNIGSPVSRSVNITIASSVAPTASNLSVSIYGSGRDKTINKFVQNISRVTASFSSSAGYGASVSSRNIVVRRVSGGANSQTINGASGTTANPVSLSGTYEAIATIKDSRGRTASVRQEFTVHAYSTPKINTFSTSRRSSPSTTVDAKINVSWSALSGDNPANITVKKGSSTLYSSSNNTNGSLNTTRAFTSQSDTSSHEYILTITDSFGRTASARASVGTSFVEFSIRKGSGVGIGKVHEQGALDIAGHTFINNGVLDINAPVGAALKINATGSARYEGYVDGVRTFYIGKGGSSEDFLRVMYFGDKNGIVYIRPGNTFDMRDGNPLYNGEPIPVGSPRVQAGKVSTGTHTPNETKEVSVTFPKPFSKAPSVVITPHTSVPERLRFGVGQITTTGFTLYSQRTESSSTTYSWIAIEEP